MWLRSANVRRAATTVSIVVLVSACGDDSVGGSRTSIPTTSLTTTATTIAATTQATTSTTAAVSTMPGPLRCGGEYGSFVVPPGWSVNKQPPGDARPSCLTLVRGGTGFFEIPKAIPDPDGHVFAVGPDDRISLMRELVANSGSEAAVLDVTTTGVVSDKPITTVAFRVVAPTAGTPRPPDLAVLRVSYVQARDGATTKKGDRQEALIVGFASGAALWFVHPGSLVQRLPPITEVEAALDLIGATFVPGPLLGK